MSNIWYNFGRFVNPLKATGGCLSTWSGEATSMQEVTQAENEVGREHGRPRTRDDREEGRGTGVATPGGPRPGQPRRKLQRSGCRWTHGCTASRACGWPPGPDAAHGAPGGIGPLDVHVPRAMRLRRTHLVFITTNSLLSRTSALNAIIGPTAGSQM